MNSEVQLLKELRRTILQMVFNANEGHIPSAFSILEIVYVLFRDCLSFRPEQPKWEDRDYFILSKGHAGAALYAVLSHFGFFSRQPLMDYCKPGSILGGHPDASKVPGVEVSSGSLGHGVAIGVGIALGLKQRNQKNKVVILVGDGEMDEGSFWESLMMIANNQLNNVVVIADCNSSQRYSLAYNYEAMVSAFGWDVTEVSGHDLDALRSVLKPVVRQEASKPRFVVARTTKGFGVQRMIGEHGWHRRTPTQQELAEMSQELS